MPSNFSAKTAVLFATILLLALISVTMLNTRLRKEKKDKVSQIIPNSAMEIESIAFKNGGNIPPKYTCDGEDVNPPLIFSGAPKSAKSLALIVDDPDAPMGIWNHWLIWNIPLKVKQIAENSFPKTAERGLNSWNKRKYGGPCPPVGTHHYIFKLYALDIKLRLGPGTNNIKLKAAIESHILAKAELVGLYSRQ